MTALTSAITDELIERVRAEEREACAKVCDMAEAKMDAQRRDPNIPFEQKALLSIMAGAVNGMATAIRMRGKQ